jgi:1A family penicillin-binding protein
LAALILIPVAAVAAYVLSRDAWHMLDEEKLSCGQLSVQVFDGDDQLFSALSGGEERLLTQVADLPEHVKNAFIAAEDARFYDHPGVDAVRILGAAWSDLKAGAFVEGASTITQQLIKLTHLNSRKELSRKVDEAILAVQLERVYGKDQILEMYLNTVYFGSGYYGLETAARGYFGVSASELTLDQAALLAGILKSPARFSPNRRPEAAVGRRGVILHLMATYGMISEAEADEVAARPLRLKKDPVLERRGYYVDYALLESCRLLGIPMTRLLQDGYKIFTGMDRDAEELCEALFARDEYFPQVNGESAQGAICLIDAHTGYISALVGGRDEHVALGFNRAVRIRRQPGSVIKPILVYAPALEAGYTAADMLLDEASTFGDYAPSDASRRYRGWVTMREAVTRSLNIPAVELFSSLGIGRCKSFARQLGIPFDKNDTRLALALGGFTYGVSPQELCAAYAAFAAGGVYRPPTLIRRIEDREGKTVYEARPFARRVMAEGSAFILTSMLQSVVQHGTAKALADLPLDVAAKTGTVGNANGNRDVWLAAYTAEHAAVIWMGFDENSNGKVLPPDSGGGGYPAALMKEVLTGLYAGKTAPVFRQPDSVVRVRLDGYTMDTQHETVLATAYTPESYGVWEYFLKGTEPTEPSPYWSVPEPPDDLALSRSGSLVTVRFTPRQSYIRYLLYRESADGYATLLAVFEGAEAAVFTDDVSGLQGNLSYYVIPVHPGITVEGSPLAGPASEKASLFLYAPDSFLNAS